MGRRGPSKPHPCLWSGCCLQEGLYLDGSGRAQSLWLCKSPSPTPVACRERHYFSTQLVRCSIVVSISACHAEDPGSLPGGGVLRPVRWFTAVLGFPEKSAAKGPSPSEERKHTWLPAPDHSKMIAEKSYCERLLRRAAEKSCREELLRAAAEKSCWDKLPRLLFENAAWMLSNVYSRGGFVFSSCSESLSSSG